MTSISKSSTDQSQEGMAKYYKQCKNVYRNQGKTCSNRSTKSRGMSTFKQKGLFFVGSAPRDNKSASLSLDLT